MKFSTTIILFTASALALPTSQDSQAKKAASPYCAPGLFNQAQCCSTDVAGVANLDCATPSKTPTSASDFGAICAKSGKTARCCVLPILGQALLCQNPV
ncbi:hypothetical protein MBLNU13_g04762t1 [Cladosporium sp. NU13]